MACLEKISDVFILYLPKTITIHDAVEIKLLLDQVERNKGDTALVLASKDQKIFVAGMDLKYISKHGIESGIRIAEELMLLLAKLLKLAVPCVAAINGHAVAAGLLLALGADYRVMNESFGVLKMSEIFLGFIIPTGASLVLKSKLPPSVHRDLSLRGRSFGPKDALENKIVDELVPGENVISRAVEMAQSLAHLGKNKDVYRQLKISCYCKEIEANEKGEFDKSFAELMIRTSPKL
jgi:enoyl-CoA hydratase/carnithine racemase